MFFHHIEYREDFKWLEYTAVDCIYQPFVYIVLPNGNPSLNGKWIELTVN